MDMRQLLVSFFENKVEVGHKMISLKDIMNKEWFLSIFLLKMTKILHMYFLILPTITNNRRDPYQHGTHVANQKYIGQIKRKVIYFVRLPTILYSNLNYIYSFLDVGLLKKQ